MSPFAIAVVLILSVLFIVMSIIPLLSDQTDMDSSFYSSAVQNKHAH